MCLYVTNMKCALMIIGLLAIACLHPVISLELIPDSFIISSCALDCSITFNPTNTYILNAVKCAPVQYGTPFSEGTIITGVYAISDRVVASEPKFSNITFKSTLLNPFEVQHVHFGSTATTSDVYCTCITPDCYTIDCNSNDFQMDIFGGISFPLSQNNSIENMCTQTYAPTDTPTNFPTRTPTDTPSDAPSSAPSNADTNSPTQLPILSTNSTVSTTVHIPQNNTPTIITVTVPQKNQTLVNDQHTEENKPAVIIIAVGSIFVVVALVVGAILYRYQKASTNERYTDDTELDENTLTPKVLRPNPSPPSRILFDSDSSVFNINAVSTPRQYSMFPGPNRNYTHQLYDTIPTDYTSKNEFIDRKYEIPSNTQCIAYDTLNTEERHMYDLSTATFTDTHNTEQEYDLAGQNGFNPSYNTDTLQSKVSNFSDLDNGYIDSSAIYDNQNGNQDDVEEFNAYDNAL